LPDILAVSLVFVLACGAAIMATANAANAPSRFAAAWFWLK
jgi:hypothetical protein